MLSSSRLEISRSALKHNLNLIRDYVGDDVNFASVIKGNAYGHSIEAFVPIAEECGINYFGVYSADEAFRVHQMASENTHIMIMGSIENEDLSWAIKKGISFFVFDFDRLEGALEKAQILGMKARIHVEVETGLNRTGFNHQQVRKVLTLLKEYREHFYLEGLCTHYAGAESIANDNRIRKQYKQFNLYYKKFVKFGIPPKYRHTACSAAMMSYPKTRMDMVRIGILQYGFWPSRETFINYISKRDDKTDPLKRVISWKSKVMVTKDINEGEFVGYGTTYLAGENMKVAVVPVGYANGYSRSLSNQGRVLINDKRVPIVGIVNMNVLLVDISEIPETKKGDEVILIGNKNGISISVAAFGELSNQLNYELLTRLPLDIPRIIVD